MVVIRTVERHLAEAKKEGLIGGPVHLGVGQEAIAVGVSLKSAMEHDGIWSASDHDTLIHGIATSIGAAWEQAMKDPCPESAALLDRVYAPRRVV